MTVHSHPHAADELETYEDVIRFWQSIDEPLSHDELHEFLHPPTPRIVVAARCFYALLVLTILVCLPMALRAAGHALG